MYQQTTIHHLTFTKFSGGNLPGFIKNIVEVRGRSTDTSLRLDPRNTPEILINLGGPLQGAMDGQKVVIENNNIQGSKTMYVDVWHPKSCHFISIRFTPNGYYKFLGIPQQSFTDHFFRLEEVMRCEIEQLVCFLRQAPGAMKRFQLLIQWLKKHHRRRELPPRLLSDFVIDELDRNPRLSVNQLVEKSGYTRKHLVQRFKEEAGLTVKAYQQINRLHRLLKSLPRKEEFRWSCIACEHGYYDQSHLIKDFRRFTGHTPAEFVQPDS